VGKRKAVATPVHESVIGRYRRLVRDILSSETSGEICFGEDGGAVYSAFFDEIEPKLTPSSGELEFIADWAGKLHGNMARFAGLIHCIAAFSEARKPTATPINAAETRAAIVLARYFLAHAKAVYTSQAEPREITNAKYLWERIKSIKSIKFSKVDLTRKVQYKGDLDYSESLKTLINKGYIRIDSITTGNKGRPVETITVNPKALKNID
jgi:hypothetical protein